MLAPLAALRERRGVRVRMAPFARLARGAAAGDEARGLLARVLEDRAPWWTRPRWPRADALVLLDGAQGLGAVPTRVGELGCDFYAASAQKWLCGPNGLGYLYVREELAGRLPAPWPNYGVLSDSTAAFELDLHPGRAPLRHRLPRAAPDRVGAGRARRARGGRLRGAARARRRAGGGACRPAGRARGAARALHARLLDRRRPRGHGRAPARRGLRGAQPAGQPLRAGLGGRLVEPGRARAPGRAR